MKSSSVLLCKLFRLKYLNQRILFVFVTVKWRKMKSIHKPNKYFKIIDHEQFPYTHLYQGNEDKLKPTQTSNPNSFNYFFQVSYSNHLHFFKFSTKKNLHLKSFFITTTLLFVFGKGNTTKFLASPLVIRFTQRINTLWSLLSSDKCVFHEPNNQPLYSTVRWLVCAVVEAYW